MTVVVPVHSFRGGTGKSNLTANLAATLAVGGKRVAVVDTDIQSPGIHVLFGVEQGDAPLATLNDYLHGKCGIAAAAHDVTGTLGPGVAAGGMLALVPSSIRAVEIARVLREGYEVNLLNDGIQELSDTLRLDFLFIDTHPGLNEETLLSFALSDTLVLILRPDQQDFQGTAVAVEVARRLGVDDLLLVVNKALPSLDFAALRDQVERTYAAEVGAVLPLNEEMVRLGSGGLVTVQHPDHPYSAGVRAIAARMLRG